MSELPFQKAKSKIVVVAKTSRRRRLS